jgi:hypothetical protein
MLYIKDKIRQAKESSELALGRAKTVFNKKKGNTQEKKKDASIDHLEGIEAL